MQQVRTAVIGVGYLGRFHAQKYAALPAADLVAVVDASAENRTRVAAETGCRAVADYRDILGEVDAVSIATPTPLHYPIARECLERGIHVLVEKPITTTLEEARSLVETAARQGRVLQVGHLERFNAAILALAGTLRTPRFVESHRLAPFKERGTDVNVVLDLMIHDIDLIQSLVGAPIESIDAVGSSVFSAGLDIANARIRYTNGCVANTTASRVSMKMERKLRLFQDDAYISIDLQQKVLTIVRKPPAGADVPKGQVLIEERTYDQGDALLHEIEAFLH
jgi:predicted dehydrogenase